MKDFDWAIFNSKLLLVGGIATPLKIRVRQLGWWHSWMEQQKRCSKPPSLHYQPTINHYQQLFIVINNLSIVIHHNNHYSLFFIVISNCYWPPVDYSLILAVHQPALSLPPPSVAASASLSLFNDLAGCSPSWAGQSTWWSSCETMVAWPFKQQKLWFCYV